MNMLTAYYQISADCLKNYLPYVPELKLTNAKKYCGKILKEDGVAKIIYLSKFNLVTDECLIDEEDINDIIDTICHEFAHIFYTGHEQDHTDLTNTFKDLVIAKLSIKENNAKLEKINTKINTKMEVVQC